MTNDMQDIKTLTAVEETDVEGQCKESFLRKLMQLGKRNLIIILAVLLIGGAVTLNWALFTDADTPTGNTPQTDLGSLTTGNEDYFASALVNRQQARDEAMEVLQQVVDSTTALQEAKDQAYADLVQIAADIANEANIETLICAKGFAECVAVINNDMANIIVKTDGLQANQVAQIQQIVYEQSGIAPTNVKIIEKN